MQALRKAEQAARRRSIPTPKRVEEPTIKPALAKLLKRFGSRQGYVEPMHVIAENDQRRAEELTKYLATTARIGTKYLHVDLTCLADDLPPGYHVMAERLLLLDERPQTVVLSGRVGLGETALACGLCRWFRSRGRSCRYRSAYSLLKSISDAPFERKPKMRAEYELADLLVVDELGDPHSHLAGQEPELIELIDVRSANDRATLLMTNLDQAGLWELYGQKVQRRVIESGGFLIANWPRIDPIIKGRRSGAGS